MGLRNPDLDAETSVLVLGVPERQIGKLGSFLQTYKVKAITAFRIGTEFFLYIPQVLLGAADPPAALLAVSLTLQSQRTQGKKNIR